MRNVSSYLDCALLKSFMSDNAALCQCCNPQSCDVYAIVQLIQYSMLVNGDMKLHLSPKMGQCKIT